MEFRAPAVAAQQNAKAVAFLTKNLKDPSTGRECVEALIEELGNAVDGFPDWHPIMTLPPRERGEHIGYLSQLSTYNDLDHTVEFVRGFVTCPYSSDAADNLVTKAQAIRGLDAYRLDEPLYAENAHPVVVVASDVELDPDGTIRSRDALTWFVRHFIEEASRYQVAETWWNLRSNLLGTPHGSRSSLFVNQYTGTHIRKILEAMNTSGMFGPIKETSLDMLSQKKRDAIGDTLIRAAIEKWDNVSSEIEFEMRGEICKASLRDTWKDQTEISVSVHIGQYDLYVSGFYHPKDQRISHTDPQGRRDLATKFL